MKKFKIICYLFLCTAFIISCESEQTDSVEPSNLNEGRIMTAADKESIIEKNLNETNLFVSTNRVPLPPYEGELCSGIPGYGYAEVGNPGTLEGLRLWKFKANAGDALTIQVNRIDCNVDPIMGLYTGLDDTDNLTLIGVDDDFNPGCEPTCGFNWGDPYFQVVAPVSGEYTVAVWNWGNFCDYNPFDGGDYEVIVTGQIACVINIDGCDSGVANQLIGDSNMDEMLDALEAGEYRNHGQFVRAVAHLVNGWYDAGLITLEEKDAIMACAGEANIPS